MKTLITLWNRGADMVEMSLAPALPTLARFLFAAVLAGYYWSSARTKLGDGLFGFLHPSTGAYAQIFPRVFEAAGYDEGKLPVLYHLIALVAMWGEFVLPLLLILGLATRLAALGMTGFVLVQSWVDIFGHMAEPQDVGRWFDRDPGSLILDQRAFWVFVLLTLALRGAGPLSLDAALRRQWASG